MGQARYWLYILKSEISVVHFRYEVFRIVESINTTLVLCGNGNDLVLVPITNNRKCTESNADLITFIS